MSHLGLPHSAGTGHTGEHGQPNLLEQAAHRLGTVLTLCYALLSCVGIVFETLLLREFHTDFLTYAEPEDFLMAGLRHPVVLGFVALSVAIMSGILWGVGLGTRLSARLAAWRERAGAFRRLLRRVAPFAGGAYYFFLFTMIYANYHAKAIRAGEEPRMRLEFQQYGANPGPLSTEGYVVATTGRYLFFWEPNAQQMQVVPISAVQQLRTTGRQSKAEAPKEASNGVSIK